MILNMSMYSASDNQRLCGVTNLTQDENAALRSLFRNLSTDREEFKKQATSITDYIFSLCKKYNAYRCLVGGKPFFLPYLIFTLNQMGVQTYMTNVKKVTVFSNGELKTEQRHYGVVNCSIN